MRVNLADAVGNVELRQAFLDELLPDGLDYCSGVYYDPQGIKAKEFISLLFDTGALSEKGIKRATRTFPKRVRNPKFQAGSLIVPRFFAKGYRFPLFVGKGLFAKGYNTIEIGHLLKEHEGVHLRQVSTGSRIFDTRYLIESYAKQQLSPDVFSVLAETEANYNGWLRIVDGSYNVGGEYYQKTYDFLRQGLVNLHAIVSSDFTDPEKRLAQEVIDKIPHSARRMDQE